MPVPALHPKGILSAGNAERHGNGAKAAGPLITGHGLVARLSPVKGVTSPAVIKHNVYLPCILGTFTVAETALWNDYNTVSAGQFSQPGAGGPGAQQLKTMTLDTLTLAWDAKWMVVTNQSERVIRDTLQRILRRRQPVMLMINFNPKPDKTPVYFEAISIRNTSTDIRPGEGDTHYITIGIEQWRDTTTGRRGSTTGDGARKRGVSLPATVKLAAGDTLDSLSFAYYGTYAGWRAIRDANGITKKFGPKSAIVGLAKWKVGSKIKIPAATASAKQQAYGNLS